MAIGDSLGNPNLWVDGTTAFNDAISGGTPRFISLPLRKGVDYFFVVTGSGGTFDAFLTLYDTLDNGQAVLATDDNSFDSISEPLIASFVCPATGIYYLGCSTLDFDGSFTFLSADNLTASNIFYFRNKTSNKISDFFQTRTLKVSNKIGLFNQIRSKLANNTFNIFNAKKLQINNGFNANDVKRIGGSGEKTDVWSKVGYEIFANGVLIGFLPEGVFTLTDVPLANGDYEIVAKPLGNFYRNVEVKQKLLIRTTGTVVELLPPIYDLVTLINSARTYLSWTISPQLLPTTRRIGLWFSGSSGIVITGAPDASVSVGILTSYQYSFKQSISQWVAIAFYDGADRGAKSEIELPWSTVLPDAPEYQHIEE